MTKEQQPAAQPVAWRLHWKGADGWTTPWQDLPTPEPDSPTGRAIAEGPQRVQLEFAYTRPHDPSEAMRELADARQEIVALRATEDNLRAEVERLRALLRDVEKLLRNTPKVCDNIYSRGRESYGAQVKTMRDRIDGSE